MPDEEARKQLERLGLTDVLTSLCPGAVFVASAALWLPLLDFGSREKLKQLSDSVPASFLLLLVSYAIGLVLNGWAAQGFVKFVGLYSGGIRNASGLRKVVLAVQFCIVATLHGRRFMVSRETDVDARFRIYEIIRARCGESVVGLLNPNNLLYVFRVLVWCAAREKEEVALNEADALFRRRGFAQGVALASMLAALESGFELLLIWIRRPIHDMTWTAVLVGVFGAGVAASLLLRNVARRLHSDERIFTYAVLRTVESQAPGRIQINARTP
ncbi:MAG: hypothetical protein ABSH47_09200 [Bryobacteraceae bacterium]|jgi:hypothetical protein